MRSYSQNDFHKTQQIADEPLNYTDVLKKRTKIPLAEMMKLLSDAKEYIPLLKILPERVHTVELDIYELKDWLRQKYITYQQLHSMNDIFRLDLESVMDKSQKETINKVIQIIDDKVPFEYLEGIMKHKASMDTIKSAERTLIKLVAENDRLNERVHAMEMESKRQQFTFEGITRADVENMLRYKVEKVENDKKMADLEARIKYLNDKVQHDMAVSQDLFKKMEKSIHEVEEEKVKAKDQVDHTERIDKTLLTLNKRQYEQDMNLREMQAKMNAMQNILDKQKEKIKKQKQEVNKQELTQKFTDYENRFKELQSGFTDQILALQDELDKRFNEVIQNRNIFSMVESLNKRIGRNEAQIFEQEQANEQLRQFKKKQMEALEQQFLNLSDLVNGKIAFRIGALEKLTQDGFTELLEKFYKIECEFGEIKGPVMDQFNNLKCQNVSILRELERLQGSYRELISDYVKTLDAKLCDMMKSPTRFLKEMQTQDELVRNNTKHQLHKLNKEGVMSNVSVIANAINQQMLNNNSLLSLKTSPSDINYFLKQSKFPHFNKSKGSCQNTAQVAGAAIDMEASYYGTNNNVFSSSNLNLSSPQSQSNKRSLILTQNQLEQQTQNESGAKLSKQFLLKKRTPKSAVGNHRRNNNHAHSFVYNDFNQINAATSSTRHPSSSKDKQGNEFGVQLGPDYSSILNEAITLKSSKGIMNERIQQRKKQARTTLNSSMDIRANSQTRHSGARTANTTVLKERTAYNDSTISNTISNVMSATINNNNNKTNTIENDENENEGKMQKMLDKELPITLHRFRHLMNNDK